MARAGMTSTRARVKMRRILMNHSDAIKDALKDSVNSMEKEMRSRVPKDTGITGEDITSFVSKGKTQFRAEVGFRGNKKTSRKYIARFVEFGTKAHKIETKKGALLVGGDIYAKSANHPGTPARPFIGPTWDSEKPKVLSRVNRAISEAIRKAQK